MAILRMIVTDRIGVSSRLVLGRPPPTTPQQPLAVAPPTLAGTDYDTAGAGTIFDSTSSGDVAELLAATGRSFEGCVAVLNNGHWVTMASRVTSHEAGTGNFTYDNPECGSSCPGTRYNDDGKGRYYMEACPAALSVENEWSYDLEGKHLLVRLPGGVNPSTVSLHGKVATWAIVLYDCSNVTLKGLRFFATTVGMAQSGSTDGETGEALGGNSVVGSVFDYSTASFRPRGVAAELTPDRLPGYAAWPLWYREGSTLFQFPGGAPMFSICQQQFDCATNSRFVNNTIRHTDSPAMVFTRGDENLVENNVLEHIDYAAVGNAFTVDAAKSGRVTYTRNSVRYAGASEGFRASGKKRSQCTLNHHSRMGLVQYDGSSFQGTREGVNGSEWAWNWVDDTAKLAFRFDAGETGDFGAYGTIHHNVAIRALSGFQIKGFSQCAADGPAA